jgi:uncharacterized protein (DUF4213/DUF364 family)
MRHVGLGRGSTVLNIGAVGEFVREAQDRGMTALVTDLDPQVIGKSLHGTIVQDAARNDELLRVADVALVTGMTLWTQTLHSLITRALELRKPIVLFAETAANIAPFLIGKGVAAVFSEPFPFYVIAEHATINFHATRPQCD